MATLDKHENDPAASAPVTPMYAPETAASRYDRAHKHQGKRTVPDVAPYGQADDRKARELDFMDNPDMVGNNNDSERKSRLYVDRETGVSATGASSETLDELFDASQN